jgi:ABC-type anion transport system duplicated permease subunit
VVLSQVGTGIGKLIDQSVFSGNLTLTLLALGGMVVMVLLINRFVWQRLYKSVTNKYRIEV